MKHLRWIAVIIVMLLVVIVVVQNYESLITEVSFKVDLMFWSGETSSMPLSLVAIITFLIGVIFSGAYGMTERFHLKKEIRNIRKETKEMEKELNSLRNLPVTSEVMEPEQAEETQETSL